MRRWRLLLAGAVLPVVLCGVLWLALPLGSEASSQGRLSQLQNQIQATKGAIGSKQGKEQVLTSDIAGYSAKIRRLQGSIGRLQQREDGIQSDLDRRRADLARTQGRLRAERARLARLRARLAQGRRVLSKRLVEIYEADRPDLVSVVLNSHGFADLLERGEFLSRIQSQDDQIITMVQGAKADATATAHRLAGLERHQQQLTAIVLQRRNQVSQVRMQLVGQRSSYEQAKAGRQRVLASVRSQRQTLESHLSALEKESQKIQAQLQAAATGVPATAYHGGGGQLTWPVNGPITSPFCESRPWEACHPGIDIGVPIGTPIHAADAGRVVIAGWVSGYGNYTCIQHTATLSTCYGHQSVLKVSVGQTVSRGQIIGLSGNTGHSTGPHLHFEVRVNGAVTNPLNYL